MFRNKMRHFVPILLIASITLGILAAGAIGAIFRPRSASADAVTDNIGDAKVKEEDLQSYYEVMDMLENELAKNNTTALDQLDNQLSRYETMLSNGEYNDMETMQSLIATTEDLIAKYEEYDRSKMMRAKTHPTYTPMIAGAIAVFEKKGYYLSSELLTAAKDNDVCDKLYKIQHTNIIKMGTKFKEISSGTSVSGSSTFHKTSERTDQDLYYSIKTFDYVKRMPNSRAVTITDRYDFGPNEEQNGDSLEDKVVEKFYEAQAAGALVPFKIKETLEPITEVSLKPNYSYKETFDLYKNEKRNFSLSLYNCNKLTVTIDNAKKSTNLYATSILWENVRFAVANFTTKKLKFTTSDAQSNSDIAPFPIFIEVMNTLATSTNTVTITIICE